MKTRVWNVIIDEVVLKNTQLMQVVISISFLSCQFVTASLEMYIFEQLDIVLKKKKN